jgi:hypothetical protein
MESKITCIVGVLEAVGASSSFENKTEYTYMRFSLLLDNDVKMIERVFVGNLIKSYLNLELKGNFYFVNFYDQLYLVGLRIDSRRIFDREYFSSIASEVNHRLREREYHKERAALNSIRLTAIILGLPFVIAIIFPPLLVIIFLLGWLIKSILDKWEKKLNRRIQKDVNGIEQEINFLLAEIEKSMG